MSSANLVRLAYVKESSYGVTPSAVAASLVVQDLTYTAKTKGTDGNDITITYLDGGTAGAETVEVDGTDIIVHMDDGVSIASDIKDAIEASDADDLVSVEITGTGGDAQDDAAEAPLVNGAGDFQEVRFISESLSGSPETTESKQLRTDRMSSGQVVTGLSVGGNHNFELAKEKGIEDFMESAMLNAWDTSGSTHTRTLTISISGKTITAGSGSFNDEGVAVGDFWTLSGFTDTNNNVQVMITSIESDTVVKFIGPEGMTDGSGGATAYKRADKLSIGTTKKSLSIEKAFLDLTTKALLYRGMMANTMSLKVAYGALITGAFGFSGNDYDNADSGSEFMTYGIQINDPPTTNTLNGSVDMPFLGSNIGGSFLTDEMCIQSLDLDLNNNMNPQNCIGNSAPENYTPGTAQINVSMSTYLKDGNWSMLAKKLSQESFSIGFMVKNGGGWYGFYIPAIQVSFDDPASGGQNQDVSLDMKGQAKVGSGGVSALVIFRSDVA